MTYINVAKPTGSTYTNVNAFLPSFDEPTLTYDDLNTFYDGINQSAYTSISKPVSTAYTSIAKPT